MAKAAGSRSESPISSDSPEVPLLKRLFEGSPEGLLMEFLERLPEGSWSHIEFAAGRDFERPWEFVYRTSAEAALHTAQVWGEEAFAAQRLRIESPDGIQITGPWRLVDHE